MAKNYPRLFVLCCLQLTPYLPQNFALRTPCFISLTLSDSFRSAKIVQRGNYGKIFGLWYRICMKLSVIYI